jgi:hypothetical protein
MRGGKRPGAGRPVKEGEKMIRISGRLTPTQYEMLKKAGGFSAIRRIINFCFITDNDLRQFIYFDK